MYSLRTISATTLPLLPIHQPPPRCPIFYSEPERERDRDREGEKDREGKKERGREREREGEGRRRETEKMLRSLELGSLCFVFFDSLASR